MPEVETALPGYYTTKEAAEKLGYKDPSSIKNLCLQGRIFAYKVEKMWFIPESVIAELEKGEVKPQGNRGVSRK